MNNVLPQETLQKVFDQALRGAMETMGGIRLTPSREGSDGALCTVCAAFERGFSSSLSLRAETSVLTRLTQFMMQEEDVAQEDVEDFTKEFFNVLCGHISSMLFGATKVASRFGIPAFYRGRYQPEHLQEQFVLCYSSDRNERVELVHHTPVAE